VRLLAVGTRALMLEVDDVEALARWRAAVAGLVAKGLLAPPAEIVPGARTLLLDGVDPAAVAGRLAELGELGDVGRQDVAPSPLVEVPVVYDGADLAEIARRWGITERDVVARHTGTEFRVAFCGFAPGFPYLVGMDGEVPRRAAPRPAVPAGSVGLAGRYCGIYPTCSPGGWQLLGTTGAQLFDADRDPPALLPPGTRVRFVEVASVAAADPAPLSPRDQPNGRTMPTVRPNGRTMPTVQPNGRTMTVLRAGALTTMQDAGRFGLAHLGVPRAGALDPEAARLANRLVGNREDAAVLETTMDGVALRAETTLTVAVTGAPAAVTAAGAPASWGVAVGVGAGQRLEIGSAILGVRSYVAVAGGFAVKAVLGSRSTDILARLGPPPLSAGDVLPVGAPTTAPPAIEFTVPRPVTTPVVLRLTPGPREDWFGPASLAVLMSAPYLLSELSNRVGARLVGPHVPRLFDGELESEGLVLGAVQVPPDGAPVVLLADHPTTGGYPVIAVVHPGDLGPLAQVRPGAPIRFVLSKTPQR